ncbi:radical SAM protein [Geobacter sp. FeAm09]|uniref:radical SAM protein n=1 Tax=Geobacter sp. FeAm09 TaxID=2597769 RepID=UPI0011ED903E|nr:radical SAM protein [Geobacter sp. FeAm09]QEM66727.1 radical SAM protein [Geobacter sp. FeAm09]
MENKTASAFDKYRGGHGTKEWAEETYSIGTGCAHGCLYCSVRSRQMRLKRIGSREEWLAEKIRLKATGIKALRTGVIMFPSSHDISPHYLDHSIEALRQTLAAGNKVLIVSKPHIECIRTLIGQLVRYRHQILFRFTIGALDEDLVRLWEPYAPPPEERLAALEYAYAAGFNTSVSIEPMLAGVQETLKVVDAVSRSVSETIWIGKMNRIRERVDGMNKLEVARAVELLMEQQTDGDILELTTLLQDNPQIRWKDSIKKVLAKHRKKHPAQELLHSCMEGIRRLWSPLGKDGF